MTLLCCCRSRPHHGNNNGTGETQPRPLWSESPLQPVFDVHPSPVHHGRSLGHPPPAAESSKKDEIVSAVPVAFPGKGLVDLEQLVIDDSEGEGRYTPLGRRASATWEAVRNRLTRHISLESSFKKQTPSLTGRSQEEIARRAELKRLMHKRIQDELLCDDSLVELCTDDRRSTRKASLTNLSQPGGGPRDTIEFIVKNKDHVNPSSSGSEQHEGVPKFRTGPVTTESAGATADQLLAPQDSCMSKNVKICYETRPIPTTSRGKHQSGQGSCKSLQHSSNSTPLDNLLRHDKDKSDSRDSQSWETHSVLAMWLRSQSIRSREPSFARLDETENDAAATDARKLDTPSDHEQIEIGIDTSPSILRHTDTNRLKDVERPVPRSTELSRRSGADQSKAYVHGRRSKDTDVHVVNNGIALSPSQDLAQSYAVAMAYDNAEDASSSAYPSVMPSIQTSPMTSQSNIFYNLNARDLQSVHLASLPCKLLCLLARGPPLIRAQGLTRITIRGI